MICVRYFSRVARDNHRASTKRHQPSIRCCPRTDLKGCPDVGNWSAGLAVALLRRSTWQAKRIASPAFCSWCFSRGPQRMPLLSEAVAEAAVDELRLAGGLKREAERMRAPGRIPANASTRHANPATARTPTGHRPVDRREIGTTTPTLASTRTVTRNVTTIGTPIAT